MKLYALLLILSLALSAQQAGTSSSFGQRTAAPPLAEPTESKPEDQGTVEGRVLNATTGDPVNKANLILRRAEGSAGMGPFPTSYSTTTDAEGKFAMKDIDPGKYRLSVNRTGFVNAEYGARGAMRPGTTLSLDPKQHLQDVVFR